MNNIFSFEALWADENVVDRPIGAIEDLKDTLLEKVLEKPKIWKMQCPDAEDLIDEIAHIVSDVLTDATYCDNDIVLRFLGQGDLIFGGDNVRVLETLLSLWYISIMPALGRDPSFEFPDEESLNSSSDSEEDGSGDHEEKEDDNIDKYGSLGLTAMLLTAGVWRAPKQPKLKMPSLIANSITSVLFAGYLISFHAREDILVYLSEQGLARKAFTAYMQCAWQMARVNQESHAQPCQEYGVLLPDEVMVSPDGRRMLTNIGRNDWHEPPFWHPCKKTPGSDWNKFFKNVGRPLFVPASFTSTHVSHRLPNTALKLVEPVEEYYESVEDRMDDSGRDRRVLTLVQSMRQYEKLAAASGCEYPDEELEEHLANSVFDAQQDYKDSVPLMKKPITDLKGHLTMPFITSVLRAMRLEEEPIAMHSELYMARFGSQEDGDFS